MLRCYSGLSGPPGSILSDMLIKVLVIMVTISFTIIRHILEIVFRLFFEIFFKLGFEFFFKLGFDLVLKPLTLMLLQFVLCGAPVLPTLLFMGVRHIVYSERFEYFLTILAIWYLHRTAVMAVELVAKRRKWAAMSRQALVVRRQLKHRLHLPEALIPFAETDEWLPEEQMHVIAGGIVFYTEMAAVIAAMVVCPCFTKEAPMTNDALFIMKMVPMAFLPLYWWDLLQQKREGRVECVEYVQCVGGKLTRGVGGETHQKKMKVSKSVWKMFGLPLAHRTINDWRSRR